MILRIILSIVLLAILKIKVYSQSHFCFVLCRHPNDCNGYQSNKCKNNCKDDFVKGSGGSNFACYS